LNSSLKDILDEKYNFMKYLQMSPTEYNNTNLKHLDYLYGKLVEDVNKKNKHA